MLKQRVFSDVTWWHRFRILGFRAYGGNVGAEVISNAIPWGSFVMILVAGLVSPKPYFNYEGPIYST